MSNGAEQQCDLPDSKIGGSARRGKVVEVALLADKKTAPPISGLLHEGKIGP